MKLDSVDRVILEGIHGSVGVSELEDKIGFSRTTILMHLHRLERLGLVAQEKVFTGRRGRPRLLYRLRRPVTHATELTGPVTVEFKKLKHLCRLEKGG